MMPSSPWRNEIAERLASLYASNGKVAAVMLGGSTARGHADGFSDMELGVFWSKAPTVTERRAVIAAADADLGYQYDYDPEEQVWSDDFYVGRVASGQPKSGLFVEVAHQLVSSTEQILRAVLNGCSTSQSAHNLIGGIVDAIPLAGAPMLEAWKAQAIRYPRELSLAVVRKHGVICHFWRWEMFLARGENLMLLYQSFAQVQQQLLHVLLGLNRVYYFGFKWLDLVADRLEIKPERFAIRLKQVYQVPPDEGARLLIGLVDEVFSLVEAHLPEIDVRRLREIFHYRRPRWTRSPLEPGRS
jgi:hypothetical protein